jgi:hypothetical protein
VDKKFSQTELNKIVSSRLKRERERLAKEVEERLKHCMAAIHLMLHQEMCAIKRNVEVETKDMLLSGQMPIKSQPPTPLTE